MPQAKAVILLIVLLDGEIKQHCGQHPVSQLKNYEVQFHEQGGIFY